MNYPLISEYIEAIKAAEDNFEKLKNLRPIMGEDGEPVMTSGNFAVVFKMKDEQTGKLHAVKCFLKEQEGRAEAYRMIAEELEYVNSTFLTPIKYLDKELFVDTKNSDVTEFPVLQMDWVEGVTLDKYIREHIDDQYELSLLAYQFSRLAMWLMPQPFAHGDLKPDNILVKNDGTLVLVDYDGMYVPAMKGQKARELGSPDFRHPSRTETDFDEHIDDFSLASILLSLKAISLQPSLLEEYGASDRLLFSEKDYRYLSESKALNALRPLMQDAELASLYSLFILALSQNNLSLVSFRLFNLERPKEHKQDVYDYFHYFYSDRGNPWIDESGVKYSGDKKCLKRATKELSEYSIRKGTRFILPFAFINQREMKSISFPEALEEIGDLAFDYCTVLKSIIIPSNIKKIGNGIFSGCFELSSIVVDKNNKYYDSRNNCNAIIESHSEKLIAGCSATTIPLGVKIIGSSAFSCCHKLKSITIPNSVVKIESNAFHECDGLTTVVISENIKEIDPLAFQDCPATLIVNKKNKTFDSRHECNAIIHTDTNTIVIGNQSTSIPNDIITIGKYSFRSCYNLVKIAISDSVEIIEEEAFAHCQYLESIKFSSNLGEIGQSAFYDCIRLKSISYPNKLEKIGVSAFNGCRNISSVYIPNSVATIEDYAFMNCKNLKTVFFSNAMISIGKEVFSGCENLDNIYIPKESRKEFESLLPEHIGKIVELNDDVCFRTTVTDEDLVNASLDEYGAKYSADRKRLLNVPKELAKFKIEQGVITICDNAFEDCHLLKNVIIPDSVKIIGKYAFCRCNSLESIIVPNSVETIGSEVFWYCRNLSDVSLPFHIKTISNSLFTACSIQNFKIPISVNVLEKYCFASCKFEHIEIPQNVYSIESDAFYNCKELKTVTIKSKLIKTVGKDVFKQCDSLKAIYIPIGYFNLFNELLPEYKTKLIEKDVDENLSTEVTEEDLANAWTDEYGVKYSKDRKRMLKAPSDLKNYSIREGTKIICNKAFKDCKDLSSVSIPNDILSIGESAFWGRNKLKSIVIPNSVISIGKLAFFECSGLTSITLSNNLKRIGDRAFYCCAGLTNLTIPSKLEDIGESAFQGCVNLNRIMVDPNNKNYDSRNNCNAIINSINNTLIIGCSSTIIPNTVTKIGDESFILCKELKTIIIPDSVKEIGFAAFPGCENLASVTISKNVDKIGNAVFLDCKSLTRVDILGKIKKLSYRTFYNCEALLHVSIPESVNELGEEVFYGCSNLQSIFIPVGTKKKFEELLPEYKDKLVEQEMGWTVKTTRPFDPEEIAAVRRAEVVASQYGNSVCFFMNGGGQTYIPLSVNSTLTVGDELNLRTAKILTLSKRGKNDITRIIE